NFKKVINSKSNRIIWHLDYWGDTRNDNKVVKITKKRSKRIVSIDLSPDNLVVDLDEYNEIKIYLTDIGNPYILKECIDLKIVPDISKYTFETKMKNFAVVSSRMIEWNTY